MIPIFFYSSSDGLSLQNTLTLGYYVSFIIFLTGVGLIIEELVYSRLAGIIFTFML